MKLSDKINNYWFINNHVDCKRGLSFKLISISKKIY